MQLLRRWSDLQEIWTAVKAAQYVILGVWAYGESIVELKQL